MKRGNATIEAPQRNDLKRGKATTRCHARHPPQAAQLLVALSGLLGFCAFSRPPAVILMYHHVTTQVVAGPYAAALTVAPAEFDGQLRWLRSYGCAMVTVNQILSDTQKAISHCEVALTFDDGYDDAVRLGLPILQKYGARATFYVTSGYVGTPGHVTRAALARLQGSGMEIAAHSVHHYDLTTLPPPQLQREVLLSRRSLQRWSGAPVSSFAYPAGRLNRRVVDAVRAAGFANAVTTDPGFVNAGDDRFALPRYRVLRSMGIKLFAAVIEANTKSGPARLSAAAKDAAHDVLDDAALHNIARARIAGNQPQIAEKVAVALLARRFAEPISKVHVLAIPGTAVAGIALSGTKFHRPLNRRLFLADVYEMAQIASVVAPSLSEVDIWATVPMVVPAGEPVSGDYAVPAARTVFSSSATVRRQGGQMTLEWGTTFWDPTFLKRQV